MMKIIGFLVLLLIVGMAIPSARVRIFEAVSPVTNRLKAATVPRKLTSMADQLEVRIRTKGAIPAGGGAWEGWLRSGFSGEAEDPWGSFYYLKMDRREGFVLGSMGPDGEPDTEDDITETR
jgi:hypothetical protein